MDYYSIILNKYKKSKQYLKLIHKNVILIVIDIEGIADYKSLKELKKTLDFKNNKNYFRISPIPQSIDK